MVIAQVFFAGMNVCTRLGARTLPWSEIAATRFLVGALIALGFARYRGSSLRITDRPSTWRRSLFGTLAAIATAGSAFYAFAMIWLRKIGPGESQEAVVCHFSVVAFLTFLALAIPVWRRPDWLGTLILLGAGVGGGGGQMAMTRAYALHRAAPVTAVSGLGIVLTYLLAIPVFGDRPTGWQLLGSLLVIGASLLLATSREGVAEHLRTAG
jgi:drug/metabolite transporter (DMT)-like permease